MLIFPYGLPNSVPEAGRNCAPLAVWSFWKEPSSVMVVFASGL